MTVFSLRRVFFNVGLTVVGGLITYAGVSRLLVPACSSWFRERETVREIVLPEGRKVEGTSWKDGDLWVLTRPVLPGEGCQVEHNLTRSSGWSLVRERFVVREREVAKRDAGSDDGGEL